MIDDGAPVDELHIGGRGAPEHFLSQLRTRQPQRDWVRSVISRRRQAAEFYAFFRCLFRKRTPGPPPILIDELDAR
jgi:hypothetical protein